MKTNKIFDEYVESELYIRFIRDDDFFTTKKRPLLKLNPEKKYIIQFKEIKNRCFIYEFSEIED